MRSYWNTSKSATFPAIGRAGAAYMTPGAQLTGNTVRVNEQVINIDQLLVSDTFVANIDEAMNHFDVRGEFAYQLGEALARTADENIFRVGILGARAGANITGTNGTEGGSSLVHANSHTTASLLLAALFEADEKLNEKDVPKTDRFVALRPAQYSLLVQDTTAINRDWAGEGSYAQAVIPTVAGFQVVMSNNIPSTNIASSPSGAANIYHGNFANTVCFCWHRSGIGTVSLLGLAVEREYLIQNQGTLMVAKYAMGHDYLRPEACVEILHTAI